MNNSNIFDPITYDDDQQVNLTLFYSFESQTFTRSRVDYLLLIQGVVTFLANSALFTIIARERKLRRKKANRFYLNLLLVHCLLSIVTIVSCFRSSATKRIFKNGILFQMFTCLMINSVDRYVNIKYPFKYQLFQTRHVTFIIISSWIPAIISIILSASFRMSPYTCTVVCTTMMVFATCLLLTTNIGIYRIARYHVEGIKQQSVTTDSDASKRIQLRMHLKASFVCFALVISFIILWFPYFVHNVMILSGDFGPIYGNMFSLVVIKLSFLNSLVDPFLFVMFSKDLKRVLARMFGTDKDRSMYDSTFNTSTSQVQLSTWKEGK